MILSGLAAAAAAAAGLINRPYLRSTGPYLSHQALHWLRPALAGPNPARYQSAASSSAGCEHLPQPTRGVGQKQRSVTRTTSRVPSRGFISDLDAAKFGGAELSWRPEGVH